jgi:uncharacterized delta-60 repeat protein
MGGYCASDFILAQYLEDGSLDTDFSGDGMYRLNSGSDDFLYDIAIQDDEKIVAIGSTSNGESSDFAIIRLNEDGSLDNTFSSDGMATIDFGTFDYGRAVTLQEDGKIIIAGYTGSGDYEYDLAMCRLKSDGSLDNSFGSNGKIIYDANWESDDYINDVVIYEGNIFVSGYCYGSSKNRNDEGVIVLKYNESGFLDNSFGDNGLAYYLLEVFGQIIEAGSKLAINQNGIYVAAHVADWTYSDMAVVSFLHNGYPNDDFGSQGLVVIEMIGSSNTSSILLQSDDKIVVGGSHETGNDYHEFCLARFLVNGELDADFGNHYGVTFVDIAPGHNNYISDMAFQTDGKIVTGGVASDGFIDNFALARFYSGLEVGIPEVSTDVFDYITVINPVVSHRMEISFRFPEAAEVEAQLFDIRGADLGMVFREKCEKGIFEKTVGLNAALPQGVYVLQLTVNGERKSYRLVVQ